MVSFYIGWSIKNVRNPIQSHMILDIFYGPPDILSSDALTDKSLVENVVDRLPGVVSMRPALPLDQILHAVFALRVAPLLQQSLGGVNPLRFVQRFQPHVFLGEGDNAGLVTCDECEKKNDDNYGPRRNGVKNSWG